MIDSVWAWSTAAAAEKDGDDDDAFSRRETVSNRTNLHAIEQQFTA